MSDRYLGKLIGYDKGKPMSGTWTLKFECGEVFFDWRMADEFVAQADDEPFRKYEVVDGRVLLIED